MKFFKDSREPWIVNVGWWLTKRRSIIFAPVFAVALLTARPASHFSIEILRDCAAIFCLWAGTHLRLVSSSYHQSSHGKEPITAGPYAWVRHPIYCANFLVGFGMLLVAGWWPILAVYLLLFFPLHMIFMKAEEVYLVSFYGDSYRRYMESVPVIFPWRRYHGPKVGQPNEFKMQRGQERLKAVGYVTGVVALIFFKYTRFLIPLPSFKPLPAVLGYGVGALALLGILCRPKSKTQWAGWRILQAVAVVVGILFLVIHIPGVWPSSDG